MSFEFSQNLLTDYRPSASHESFSFQDEASISTQPMPLSSQQFSDNSSTMASFGGCARKSGDRSFEIPLAPPRAKYSYQGYNRPDANNSNPLNDIGGILKEVQTRLSSTPLLCGRMLEEGLVFLGSVLKSNNKNVGTDVDGIDSLNQLSSKASGIELKIKSSIHDVGLSLDNCLEKVEKWKVIMSDLTNNEVNVEKMINDLEIVLESDSKLKKEFRKYVVAFNEKLRVMVAQEPSSVNVNLRSPFGQRNYVVLNAPLSARPRSIRVSRHFPTPTVPVFNPRKPDFSNIMAVDDSSDEEDS